MRTTIIPGLVFSIQLSEKMFGFGQLVEQQKPTFYMVAYDLRSESSNTTERQLRDSKTVLMGNFFDILIRNGRWKSVARMAVPKIPFPCFKIKISDKFYVESWDRERIREATPSELAILLPRTNYSPIILEDALKAYFKLEPWQRTFDPLKAESVAKISEIC